MQAYQEITGDSKVKDSRQTINDNFVTVLSNNSGAEFPTENLFVGMNCWRTDLGKMYVLSSLDPIKWEISGDNDAIIALGEKVEQVTGTIGDIGLALSAIIGEDVIENIASNLADITGKDV